MADYDKVVLTVTRCAFCRLGFPVYEEDFVEGIDPVKARGKTGWPESPWQADLIRQWRVNS